MNEVQREWSLGPALAFYAKFTGELNMLWGRPDSKTAHQLYRDHFKSSAFKQSDFRELLGQTSAICDTAEREVTEIVDCFHEMATADAFYKAAAVIKPPAPVSLSKAARRWSCYYDVHKKGVKKTTRMPCQFGMWIDVVGGDTLYAVSWIWVRGQTPQGVLEALRPRGRREPVEYPGEADSHLVCLHAEKLIDAVQSNDSVGMVASRLFEPFRGIGQKGWTALLELGK